MRIVDLSLTIRPHWRWQPALEVLRTHEEGHLFRTSALRMGVHGFTHVDALLHFLPGGASIAEMPLASWAGPAAVVDVSHVSAGRGVRAADLERAGAHVRRGDIAILKTCWEDRCPVESREYWTEGPYLARDGAEWLLARGVKGVGADFPGDEVIRRDMAEPDRVKRPEDYVTHDVLLRNGVMLIEYLSNLRALSRPRVLFLALPLKIQGADGSPCRAVALELDADAL